MPLLIVFKIFLTTLNVLVWSPSFKMQSLSNAFEVLFGIILQTIFYSVNLSASLLRSKNCLPMTLIRSNSVNSFHVPRLPSVTEGLVMLIVNTITKNFLNESLRLVSKGRCLLNCDGFSLILLTYFWQISCNTPQNVEIWDSLWHCVVFDRFEPLKTIDLCK